MEKDKLRKSMKKLLASLDPVAKAFESMNKCVVFIQSEKFKNADIIFGFMPTRDELDIMPILRTALELKKKVLVPKVNGTEMDFYFMEKDLIAETKEGAFGIYEPYIEENKANISKLLKDLSGKKALILVPGLAFGKDHTRLGKGKGFYDRFLSLAGAIANEKPAYIGVCYDAQVLDTVPHQEHDVLVDCIL